MAEIHPTAIVDDEVTLADDVFVGPWCVLRGAITIGSGSRLLGNAWLQGPLTMGERNTVYPFVTLGFSPQDLKWDPQKPGAGLAIGTGNTFREHVTIHRATSDDEPSRMGDSNYFMATAHAGHDCHIGSHCIFANGTLLGGFVEVGNKVITGGHITVHQFCRIGRGAMLTGSSGLTHDLPPYFMLTAGNVCGAVNLVGLRRSGMPREDIDTVRWVYRTIYRRGQSPQQAVEELRQRAENPLVREYIEFIESSKRTICPAKRNPIRGTA